MVHRDYLSKMSILPEVSGKFMSKFSGHRLSTVRHGQTWSVHVRAAIFLEAVGWF